jgi:tRNA A37 threonylcarbamoyladenosine modification protein TsaB
VSHDQPPSAPVTLVIEVSNPGAGDRCAFVALATPAGGLIDHEPLSPLAGGRDDLHPAIERLCARANVSPERVSRVAVSVGPGGYTSLRVAVAAAVMIAEVTGAELVALPTAAVVSRSVKADPVNTDPVPRPFGVALASKGDACHVTRFDAETNAETMTGLGVVRAEALAGHGLRALVADRHLPEPIRVEAGRLGIVVYAVRFDPQAACSLAAELPAISADELAVRYAREPDAVTQWRARKSDGS